MCLPATVICMANSMLLWWTLDIVVPPIVFKPKVVTEALQWSGKRRCKVKQIEKQIEPTNKQTDKQIEPTSKLNRQTEPTSKLNLQCNYVALVERHFRSKNNWLGENLTMNFLLMSFSVTTIADARKGKVWAHDQPSALWRNTRKMPTSQESNPCIRPKFPKSPSL